MAWLMANIGTLTVLLVLAALIAAAVAVMRRDKKKGRSSCGGSCASCSMNCGCDKISSDNAENQK